MRPSILLLSNKPVSSLHSSHQAFFAGHSSAGPKLDHVTEDVDQLVSVFAFLIQPLEQKSTAQVLVHSSPQVRWNFPSLRFRLRSILVLCNAVLFPFDADDAHEKKKPAARGP
ncbi:hypothetical protein GJ744_007684 [Endocarpon pusillum]|uniref:Uncharacterized protein n=1 Tax=Endocarpon pusillum TaxID=364733 RepID=A0A8H7AMG1_9EURO|nr:hypothetical protein GJ744_007684 [Endocarpon pusillum]